MELPRIGRSDRGVFTGIKNKLGFATEEPLDNYDDEKYDDDYDDGYSDYNDGYGTYDEYEQGRGRPSQGAYVPAASRTPRTSSRSSLSPRLVSMDDVKTRTQIPDSLNRDPLPTRNASPRTTTSYGSAQTAYEPRSSRYFRTVERASDYLKSTGTSDLPSDEGMAKSSGYDSLFSSTTAATPAASVRPGGTHTYDPYDSYAGTGVSSHNPSRSLTVLKPAAYSEVERIAKVLRAGDVVVLSLRNTPDHLAKRILDFSFGVSSALDASVDCIADKVFAIIRGRSLCDEEKQALRNQGVL